MQGLSSSSQVAGIVSLSGSISSKNFVEVFEDISKRKLSGVLKIGSSKKEYRFYFREGIIIYSENSKTRTDEKILEMIKSSGVITRDTIIKSEGKKSKIMKSLLEILIEEGHVSMLLYSKIISTSSRMNVIEAAFLNKGTYSFEHRNSVREVHGVRPLEFESAIFLKALPEEKIKAIKKILGALYYNVTRNNGAEYLSENKPFFQNYLITEMDFLEYVNRAADDFLSGKWCLQNKFMTAKVADTVARYFFRTFVLGAVFTFFYLVTMTTTFQAKPEHRSVKDFYFFKISLMSSLYTFETGEKAELEKLLLNSLITDREVELSGIKNSKETDPKNKSAQ